MLRSTWRSNFWTFIAIFAIFFIGLQTVQPKVRDLLTCAFFVVGRLNLLNWQKNWSFLEFFFFFQMCGYYILRSLSVTFVDYFMIMVEWRENAELQNVSDYQVQNRSIWSLCNSHISCCQKKLSRLCVYYRHHSRKTFFLAYWNLMSANV